MKFYTALFTLLISFALHDLARAQVSLALYEFDNASQLSTDTDLDSTASNIAYGPNVTQDGSNNSAGFSSASDNAFFRAGFNTGDTFNADNYLGFTVTADPGFILNLDSLDFDTNFIGTSALDFNFTLDIRTSVDNFGTSLATLNRFPPADPADRNANLAAPTIDLSGSSFQGLNQIEVRFFFFDTGNDGSQRIYRIDNVDLQGLSIVPEPGVMALFIAVFGFLVLKRRRA